jgi:hypothetical protein
MESLTLKLFITPVLVGVASLAGRRWGPAVSGWLVGLPLTSGPIVFFLVLTQGRPFAIAVAVGTLAGAISQAVFCLCYAQLAVRWGWPRALITSCLGFATVTAILQQLTLATTPLFLLVILTLALALRLMPRAANTPSVRMSPPPSWDIPTRMIVATVFVLLLTGSAATLGPQLTGLLAPFPLYGAILAVFAHHMQGAVAAMRVLRGLLLGLFGFAGFFLALAGMLEHGNMVVAFGTASAIALILQVGTFRMLKRRSS